MLRYLKGTQHYKHRIQPVMQHGDKRVPVDIDIYTDANWGSCQTTRKSTTGFAIHYLGTRIHFASRTQAVVALSSAESELYAIGAACTEGLYIRNFVQEAFDIKTNLKIHTDSSAAKSITMREGTSKKAKHIELKHLFVQQLAKHGLISMHKIRSEHNPADILTKGVNTETLHKHLYKVGLPDRPTSRM